MATEYSPHPPIMGIIMGREEEDPRCAVPITWQGDVLECGTTIPLWMQKQPGR